ncbi:MAG TPA: hypothetical protein VF941_14875 [Clostridia bacterium]
MAKIEVYRSSDTNLINFEILISVIIVSVIMIFMAKIHAAISICIGLVSGGLLFAVFRTKIGYWIVSILFSVMWSFFAGGIAYGISKSDKIWGIVVGIIAFLISLGSHGMARRFYDNVIDA